MTHTTQYSKKELYEIVKRQSAAYDKSVDVQSNDPDQTWVYHISGVIKNALMVAKRYNDAGVACDAEVVEIAALWHDYACLVDLQQYNENHHITSGEMAEPFLRKAGYGTEFIEKVKRCIFAHRGSYNVAKNTPEEVCLADGDALTHIDNVVEIIMWQGQRGWTIKKGNDFVKSKIKKSFAKLSPQSQDYIRDKYDAIMRIMY